MALEPGEPTSIGRELRGDRQRARRRGRGAILGIAIPDECARRMHRSRERIADEPSELVERLNARRLVDQPQNELLTVMLLAEEAPVQPEADCLPESEHERREHEP